MDLNTYIVHSLEAGSYLAAMAITISLAIYLTFQMAETLGSPIGRFLTRSSSTADNPRDNASIKKDEEVVSMLLVAHYRLRRVPTRVVRRRRCCYGQAKGAGRRVPYAPGGFLGL